MWLLQKENQIKKNNEDDNTNKSSSNAIFDYSQEEVK